MADDVDDLKAARSDAIAELRRWLKVGPTGWANAKPNSNSANSLNYDGHLRTLNQVINDLTSQINTLEGEDTFEIITEVDT